jgi:hypothetical protein
MIKNDILFYCKYVQELLYSCKENNFAEIFTSSRIYFFTHYQNNLVFSTRFGSNFFSEVEKRVRDNEKIESERDKNGKMMALGEYDKNFNNWLEIVNKK